MFKNNWFIYAKTKKKINSNKKIEKEKRSINLGAKEILQVKLKIVEQELWHCLHKN